MNEKRGKPIEFLSCVNRPSILPTDLPNGTAIKWLKRAYYLSSPKAGCLGYRFLIIFEWVQFVLNGDHRKPTVCD